MAYCRKNRDIKEPVAAELLKADAEKSRDKEFYLSAMVDALEAVQLSQLNWPFKDQITTKLKHYLKRE